MNSFKCTTKLVSFPLLLKHILYNILIWYNTNRFVMNENCMSLALSCNSVFYYMYLRIHICISVICRRYIEFHCKMTKSTFTMILYINIVCIMHCFWTCYECSVVFDNYRNRKQKGLYAVLCISRHQN